MNEFAKTLNYAFLLLKYRQRSKGELVQRLRKKGFSSSVIERVIAYLEENNYLNDREFIRSFLKSRFNRGWGKKKIFAQLVKFNLSRDLVNDVLKEEAKNFNYKEKIKEIVEKRKNYYPAKKAREKLLRYLVQRGFSYQESEQVLEEILKDSLQN